MSDDAPPRAALLGRLAVGVATIQAGLSLLAWVVSITGREGLCGSGAAWSCAALLRPRLGELGPLHVTQVAIGGAFLTLVALVILRRTPLDQGGLRLGSLAVPAAGA
ncbi:MAG: hypothetical protein JKY65_24920, partial [Planctomycetes bacterium]|nr:hypothetical protein [Planctomycetota bacterium]